MAPGGEMSVISSISAKTYCSTGAMNGSPTVKTQCVQNRQTPIYLSAAQPRAESIVSASWRMRVAIHAVSMIRSTCSIRSLAPGTGS